MIINIFGEPCSGKSTAASYIFSQLKMHGVNCEYVTEFAKDKVYENNYTSLANQIYVFGNQFYNIDNVYKKVDVVITDSPLPLASLYGRNNIFSEDMEKIMMKCFYMYENMNYVLKRQHTYEHCGRVHSKEESDDIRNEMKELLDYYKVEYTEIFSTKNNYDKIVLDVLHKLGKSYD